MQVARENPSAIVTDGKILVKGGFEVKDLNTPKWTEVFDPKTQTWEIVSSEAWQSPKHTETVLLSSSCCMIDNVLYLYDRGEFLWFDDKARDYRTVKGLQGLPKFLFGRRTSYVQLADYGGKMAFLWDRRDLSNECQERMISFAVIKLERCNSEEILGTVEWCDAVLKVP